MNKNSLVLLILCASQALGAQPTGWEWVKTKAAKVKHAAVKNAKEVAVPVALAGIGLAWATLWLLRKNQTVSRPVLQYTEDSVYTSGNNVLTPIQPSKNNDDGAGVWPQGQRPAAPRPQSPSDDDIANALRDAGFVDDENLFGALFDQEPNDESHPDLFRMSSEDLNGALTALAQQKAAQDVATQVYYQIQTDVFNKLTQAEQVTAALARHQNREWTLEEMQERLRRLSR